MRPSTTVQGALVIGGAIVGGFAVGRAAAIYRREGALPRAPVDGVGATLLVFGTSVAAIALTGASLWKATEEFGLPTVAGVMGGTSALALVADAARARRR